MADYPLLAPTLSALQAVKDLPTGSEVLSKLDDVDRQTRNWIYDFLSLYIDSATGKIKPSAFGIGNTFPPGVIRGSNSVSNAQQEIAQGSIRTLDLADSAVTAAKIALGTITGNKMVAGTITGDKIAAGTITSANVATGILTTSNIADLSVTDPKIAVGTITGQRIAGATITNDKMAPRSVLGPQLPVATVGQILVGGNGGSNNEFAVKTLNGPFSINKDGLLSYAGLAGALVSFLRVSETAGRGVHGGTSVVGWQPRGSGNAHPWNTLQQTRLAFATVTNGAIILEEPGVYLIDVKSPVQALGAANKHRCCLFHITYPGGAVNIAPHYGTSVDALNGSVTFSTLTALIEVTAELGKGVLQLYHWISAGVGVNGLGQAADAPRPDILPTTDPVPSEIYAEITVLRIVEPLT